MAETEKVHVTFEVRAYATVEIEVDKNTNKLGMIQMAEDKYSDAELRIYSREPMVICHAGKGGIIADYNEIQEIMQEVYDNNEEIYDNDEYSR